MFDQTTSRKAQKVRFQFREYPARIIVTYTNAEGVPQTKYITICASDGLNERDLTRFLAECLTTDGGLA